MNSGVLCRKIDTLERAKGKLEEMLARAGEYGLDHPRHTQITVFDDDDFRIVVKKGESRQEIKDEGFEKLDIKKLIYHESEVKLFYRKVRQTESYPTDEIIEEKEISQGGV